MNITTSSPNLPQDYKDLAQKARSKGATVDFDASGKDLVVTVTSSVAYNGRYRPLGVYAFSKEEGEYTLSKYHTIESDYHPWELAIVELVKYAKKHNITRILTNR